MGVSARSLKQSLILAISEGAPAYNCGEVELCAQLYSDAAERVLQHSALASVNRQLTAIMQQGLRDARACGSDHGKAAWALRRAFDLVLEDADVYVVKDDDSDVFESCESHHVVRTLPAGYVVCGDGPPKEVEGYVMLPIKPNGAMELSLLTKGCGCDTAAEESPKDLHRGPILHRKGGC